MPGPWVLVDAFVVRMTLTPAVMTLLGLVPPALARQGFAHVDIEGKKLLTSLGRSQGAATESEMAGGVTRVDHPGRADDPGRAKDLVPSGRWVIEEALSATSDHGQGRHRS